jgi:hypothetical protein
VNRIPATPQWNGGHSILALHARLTNPPNITRGFTDATSNAGCAPSAAAQANSIVTLIMLLGLRPTGIRDGPEPATLEFVSIPVAQLIQFTTFGQEKAEICSPCVQKDAEKQQYTGQSRK